MGLFWLLLHQSRFFQQVDETGDVGSAIRVGELCVLHLLDIQNAQFTRGGQLGDVVAVREAYAGTRPIHQLILRKQFLQDVTQHAVARLFHLGCRLREQLCGRFLLGCQLYPFGSGGAQQGRTGFHGSVDLFAVALCLLVQECLQRRDVRLQGCATRG